MRHVGESRSPVVIIDEFSGRVGELVEIATGLAPFPPATNFYPGLRRVIASDDRLADAYVEQSLRDAAQFVAGAFELDHFDLVEASFSIVTHASCDLLPLQRAPHFDSTEAGYLALLHYLNVPQPTGTAFYRQRATGIEVVTQDNAARFIDVAALAHAAHPASGYIAGPTDAYEEIGRVEARPDRLLIYSGSLLHSGLIAPEVEHSPDPRGGRLTANFFIRPHH